MLKYFAKDRGIALISILLILVILVMFVVAFGTLITGNQNNVSNYSGKITLQEVAEAGVAYVLYRLNDDPSWASIGPPYESIEREMEDVKGRFSITFDPNANYCSVNNLTKSLYQSRTTEPAGTIPPYTAEIIIKASITDSANNIRSTKYYSVQLTRGDFFDRHLSSEGPVVIASLSKYIDCGEYHTSGGGPGFGNLSLGFATKGMIHSNYSDPDTESIKFRSGSPMEVKLGYKEKGVVSTPGTIDDSDPDVTFDSNTVVLMEGSASMPEGYIDIDEIVAKGTTSSPPPVTLLPGIYTLEREEVDDDGDPDTPDLFEYKVKHDGHDYDPLIDGDWAEIDPDSGDFIIKKDIYIDSTDPNSVFEIRFSYDERLKNPGLPSDPIQTEDIPPRPEADGDNGISNPPELAYSFPLIRLEASDPNSYTTIYTNNCNILTSSRVLGTGAIVCDGNLSLSMGDNYGALALLSSEDLYINLPTENILHFYGLLYAKDDVIIDTSNTVNSPPPPAPSLNPLMAASIYAGDIDPSDNDDSDPNEPVSLMVDAPEKILEFGRYYGYHELLDEASRYNYAFPVRVKCYYEIR